MLYSPLMDNLCAQSLLPIRVKDKWGLIDSTGKIKVQPVFDAIGKYNEHGLAVVRRNGLKGFLNVKGKEYIPAQFSEVMALEKGWAAGWADGKWKLFDPGGQAIWSGDFEKCSLQDEWIILYKNNQKGLLSTTGQMLLPIGFEEIIIHKQVIYTRKNNKWGMVSLLGKAILENLAEQIVPFDQGFHFYKIDRAWGVVYQQGTEIIPALYQSYQYLQPGFAILKSDHHQLLLSDKCEGKTKFPTTVKFMAFSSEYVVLEDYNRLGLVDRCGHITLSSAFMEILPFATGAFRVVKQGKWGIVKESGQEVTPDDFDYIAPLKAEFALARQANRYGLLNSSGQLVIEPKYKKLEWKGRQVKAFPFESTQDKSLRLFEFDERGILIDSATLNNHFTVKLVKSAEKKLKYPRVELADYVMEHFEWFYALDNHKWGLRNIIDGATEIEPFFDEILVNSEWGISLAGKNQQTKYDFERTTFAFNKLYALVNNESGSMLTNCELLHVFFGDFQKGNPVARCLFYNGRFGLINRKGELLLRDAAYIGEYSDGMAPFSLTGRLSASLKPIRTMGSLKNFLSQLTTSNYMVDYTKYDLSFQQDAQLICDEGEWGYVDTTGKIAIAPQYSFALPFQSGIGLVEKNGKWGAVDLNEKQLIACVYDGIFVHSIGNAVGLQVYSAQQQFGLIDTLGKIKMPSLYDAIGQQSQGYIAVRKNGFWGFVDDQGKEVIPCTYKSVKPFCEGFAAVQLGQKWGYIDCKNKVCIDFQYKDAGNFVSGRAWVKVGAGYNIIDKNATPYCKRNLDKCFDFEGNVARATLDGQFGLIGLDGQWTAHPKYNSMTEFNAAGIAIVTWGKGNIKYGCINRQGRVITDIAYNDINSFQDGFALVRKADKYGFINDQGKLVISCHFTKAGPFSEGLAAVSVNGKWGYIDRTGTLVIPPQFSKAQEFVQGRAVVYENGKNSGLIDTQGNYIIAPKIDRIVDFQEGKGLVRDQSKGYYFIAENTTVMDGIYEAASAFTNGVARIQLEGKWGLINQVGMFVIPPKFAQITPFENGNAKVKVHGVHGLFNIQGDEMLPLHYDFMEPAGDGIYRLEQGDKIGYYHLGRGWIWEMGD